MYSYFFTRVGGVSGRWCRRSQEQAMAGACRLLSLLARWLSYWMCHYRVWGLCKWVSKLGCWDDGLQLRHYRLRSIEQVLVKYRPSIRILFIYFYCYIFPILRWYPYRWHIGVSAYLICIGYRYTSSEKYQGNVARCSIVERAIVADLSAPEPEHPSSRDVAFTMAPNSPLHQAGTGSSPPAITPSWGSPRPRDGRCTQLQNPTAIAGLSRVASPSVTSFIDSLTLLLQEPLIKVARCPC